MTESELELRGSTYRIGTIDAWTQFHVVRRLFPLMGAFAKAMGKPPSIMEAARNGEPASDGDEESMLNGIVAMAEVLATMSEADCDYILRACLKVCKKKQKDMWAPLLSSDGRLMFDADTNLSDLFQLTSATIQRQEGLVDFFQNLQSRSGLSVPSSSSSKESS